MAFPHRMVTRTAWFVSAVLAVFFIAQKVRPEGRSATRTVVVRERAPERAYVPAHVDTDRIILSLTMLGDDENVMEGFTLEKPMEVRVLALGEAMGGQLYDYGVILNADTRQPVWKMSLADTRHAGGSDKNRMVDEVVVLDAGNYLVHYVTDDSHAYGDWNASAPDYEALWGITLMSTGGPVDRNVVHPYDDSDNPAVVARIVGVRDDARHEEWFTLEEDADIRVYAIGEGQSGEMFDYAWIENDRGDVVWRMQYSETEHAGGAQKNRVFDAILHMPAGEYRLAYQTDDSHAFGEWNSAAPLDPYSYGVTLFCADGR